ncbi:hypothetical protein [Inediibacterium massiliense]|uniref:hypothetical protein n=1 Tax=Inediibacterium massiliense TaxID=1658111 RepID=UPI0006B60B1B|nr:hypothetical protein [Inediibacterium massiliense]
MSKFFRKINTYRIIGALINAILIILIGEKFELIKFECKYSLGLNYFIYTTIILGVVYAMLCKMKEE